MFVHVLIFFFSKKNTQILNQIMKTKNKTSNSFFFFLQLFICGWFWWKVNNKTNIKKKSKQLLKGNLNRWGLLKNITLENIYNNFENEKSPQCT